MEKEEISAGERITVGQVTLLPILRTVAHCRKGSRGIIGSGSREVLGVVVLSPAGHRAISVSGESVPLENYISQVPEIEELLRGG
ncbi:MAG: hypothetical protein ISS55_02030 [Dehalococcoidales bacterium]|nr:hypothetical protein [Dehalococcoidales bacterium]